MRADELIGRIKPYSMFMQKAERDLIKKGQEDGDRKVVFYVPNSFSQSVRFFSDHIHLDTFLVTVSPMDSNGYFTFGTNNDYTSSAARAAKRPDCGSQPEYAPGFRALLIAYFRSRYHRRTSCSVANAETSTGHGAREEDWPVDCRTDS
ncbi:MAG UNVERIFIED_CONTAM: hypothetical protein LVR29_09495 [Microcystis novacekii LVE1205-3]